MNEIGPDVVHRAFLSLSNVRESVDALIELAESKSESSALLALVKKTVKDGFIKAAIEIAEQINNVVKKYNEREVVLAGVDSEVKAVRDKYGHLDIGKTVWIDIHRIGIRRIGETAAFQFTIDDENVPGTGIPDDLAMRLYKAIDSFRTARNDRKEAHE